MPRRLLPLGASIILLVSACGGSGAAEPGQPAEPVGGGLADNCPARIVVQTDWFPQAEHGGVYELLGDDASTDKDSGATVGSLVVRGEPTGLQLEIRAGGPFLQSPVVTEMYSDDDIVLGYVGSDVAVSRFADAPTVAVFNALNVNPQVLLWNADLHPADAPLEQVAAEVGAVYVFGEPSWVRFLEAQGVLDAAKVDSGYQGNPILATEDVIHQGFVTSEPYTYANLESGAIATGHVLIHDLGWTNYPQNLAVRADRLDDLRPCLQQLVPVLQQAQLDYIAEPDRTNARIVAAVDALDSWWSQSAGSTADSVNQQVELGIIGNGSTPTFGDLEPERLDGFIRILLPILREQGIDAPDVRASDISTNEFLEPAISWAG